MTGAIRRQRSRASRTSPSRPGEATRRRTSPPPAESVPTAGLFTLDKSDPFCIFKFHICSTAASGGTTLTRETATLRAALRPTPMSLHGDSGKTDFIPLERFRFRVQVAPLSRHGQEIPS